MAMTSAERQRKYRQERRKQSDTERLSMVVSSGTYRQLKSLSVVNGLSMKGMIEKLLEDADKAALKRIKPDTQEWEDYFGALPHNDPEPEPLVLVADRHVWTCPKCRYTIEAEDAEQLESLQKGHKYLDCPEDW